MAGSDTVNRNLLEWTDRRKAAIRAFAERTASDMEAYAKPNAPWQNRTGNARQGLFGYAFERDTQLILRIAHSVDYGVYLELAHQAKYAILEPTAKRFAPQFFEDVQRLVRG